MSSSSLTSSSLPMLGIGTYLVKGEACRQAVLDALDLGIRYIDTAVQYGNEAEVGAAIRASNIPREALWISTKIGPRQAKKGYDGVVAACRESLAHLQTTYIDIVMMHWPGIANIALDSTKHAEGRRESWRALEDLQREGCIRHIAVSNYLGRHLQDVIPVPPPPIAGISGMHDHTNTVVTSSSSEVPSDACVSRLHKDDVVVAPSITIDSSWRPSVMPYLNQIEIHPLCRQTAVTQCCHSNGILVQQYAPLAQCSDRVMLHPAIVCAREQLNASSTTLALKKNATDDVPEAFTSADVCLLWGMCHPAYGGMVLGSTKRGHIQRAMELERLVRDAEEATSLKLRQIFHNMDAEIARREEVDAVADEVEFHCCWFSNLVS